MSLLKIVILFCITILLTVFYNTISPPQAPRNSIVLETFNAYPDSIVFTVKTKKTLAPGTTIRFTTSSWNGNHFDSNENDLIWHTGNDSIYPNSSIHFKQIKEGVVCSKGQTKNMLPRLSENKILIAFSGDQKMPNYFLSSINLSNNLDSLPDAKYAFKMAD